MPIPRQKRITASQQQLSPARRCSAGAGRLRRLCRPVLQVMMAVVVRQQPIMSRLLISLWAAARQHRHQQDLPLLQQTLLPLTWERSAAWEPRHPQRWMLRPQARSPVAPAGVQTPHQHCLSSRGLLLRTHLPLTWGLSAAGLTGAKLSRAAKGTCSFPDRTRMQVEVTLLLQAGEDSPAQSSHRSRAGNLPTRLPLT